MISLIDFYNYEQIKQYHYAKFIKQVCNKHKIKVSKVIIIRNENPTAFTYGSASFNARVVLTEGLFKFLNEKKLTKKEKKQLIDEEKEYKSKRKQIQQKVMLLIL